MGSLFGGLLSKNNEVFFIDVWQAHIDVINDKGLTTVDTDGTETISRPMGATSSRDLPVMDLVLIFVKSIHTRDSIRQNRNIVGDETLVLTLQNGYGNDLDLMEVVDPGNVIVGTTSHGCTILEPGKIFHAGSGITTIGPAQGNMDNALRVAEVLKTCGFDIEVKADIKEIVFHKLFVNSGINALTAILDVPNGAILDHPNLKKASGILVREAVQIANSLGYRFDEEKVFEDVLGVCEATAQNKSSMRADVNNKRKTEIEKINGAFVRIAQEQNLKAPANELVSEMIRYIESQF